MASTSCSCDACSGQILVWMTCCMAHKTPACLDSIQRHNERQPDFCFFYPKTAVKSRAKRTRLKVCVRRHGRTRLHGVYTVSNNRDAQEYKHFRQRGHHLSIVAEDPTCMQSRNLARTAAADIAQQSLHSSAVSTQRSNSHRELTGARIHVHIPHNKPRSAQRQTYYRVRTAAPPCCCPPPQQKQPCGRRRCKQDRPPKRHGPRLHSNPPSYPSPTAMQWWGPTAEGSLGQRGAGSVCHRLLHCLASQ